MNHPPALTRRSLLKSAGLAVGAALIRPALARSTSDSHPLGQPETYAWKKPDRPVTAIVIGAGGRGNAYASYARNADEWKIVGVAEPIRYRNDAMGNAHGIPAAHRFSTWQHVFDQPKFADVCVITTPDHLHFGPAMAALEAGYDLLLEKAIAQSWAQCRDILQLARKKNAIVGIGHVLRYSPYFRMLHHVVRAGYIGEVVSIEHTEHVERIHMSHSFVRGNWGNTRLSTPMLLSKSCHDLDIIRWLIGKPCRRVTSFGSLRLFRSEMAPEGAPPRCTDGCPAEESCPYSALRIYLRNKGWLDKKDTPGRDDASILEWLQRSSYGRCVYHHDNDVVDHQVVSLEFEGPTSVAFTMQGLSSYPGRTTRVYGTAGDIIGDERTLSVFDSSRNQRFTWDAQKDIATSSSGHGGGDHGLVRDFVQAVSRRDESLLTSRLESSMESHLIGFLAEDSRNHHGAVREVQVERELGSGRTNGLSH